MVVEDYNLTLKAVFILFVKIRFKVFIYFIILTTVAYFAGTNKSCTSI